jgi:hypothetical protein
MTSLRSLQKYAAEYDALRGKGAFGGSVTTNLQVVEEVKAKAA